MKTFCEEDKARDERQYILKIQEVEMSARQNPSDFLKQIIGRPVVVKLNSGVDYRGEYNWLERVFCMLSFVLRARLMIGCPNLIVSVSLIINQF